MFYLESMFQRNLPIAGGILFGKLFEKPYN